MSMKRIGIDCRELRDPAQEPSTGVGRYVFELVSGVVHRADPTLMVVLFVHADQPIPATWESSSQIEICRLPRSARRPLVGPHWIVARAMKRAQIDVLHAPATTVPLCHAGQTVVTVHDLLIYKHSEWFPGGQWLSTRVVVPRAIRRARWVITPSNAVANDVRELFTVPAERISVISHGVSSSPSDEEVATAWKSLCKRVDASVLQSSYALFVGTLEPRKNIGRLVEAFKEVVQEMPTVHLLLAGRRGWGIPDTFFERLPDGVYQLGYVTEAEKVALLRKAAVFVYPSLGEGFGLPLLEARREGARVLTSDREPMNEVAGQGSFLVDPEDTSELATLMLKMFQGSSDLITNGVQEGRVEESLPTWSSSVERTLDVYREVFRAI